jgi:hypothetical protein
VQKALLIVRKIIDPYEFEQLALPANTLVTEEMIPKIKQRLCRLSTVRKRLPLMKEERDDVSKRRKFRQEFLKTPDEGRSELDKID